jgi:hypothetical protein
VRTLSVFIFILFFFLAGFAFLLAYRLSRHHRHSYLQTYTLHLAFWNGHALVMIMQYILGSVFQSLFSGFVCNSTGRQDFNSGLSRFLPPRLGIAACDICIHGR